MEEYEERKTDNETGGGGWANFVKKKKKNQSMGWRGRLFEYFENRK